MRFSQNQPEMALEDESTGIGAYGSQYTQDQINAVPGLKEYAQNLASSSRDPGYAASQIDQAMADPVSWVQTILPKGFSQNLLDQGDGSFRPNTNILQSQQQYLLDNGISSDQVGSLVDAGIKDAQYRGQMGNTEGGILNQLTANPDFLASLAFNAVLPGLGSAVPILNDIGSGKQNLTSDIGNIGSAVLNNIAPSTGGLATVVADAINGKQNLTTDLENAAIQGGLANTSIGSDINKDVSSAISDNLGTSADLTKDLTSGALATASNLASGRSLDTSLQQGALAGLNQASSNLFSSTPSQSTPSVDTSNSGSPFSGNIPDLSGFTYDTRQMDQIPTDVMTSGLPTENLPTPSVSQVSVSSPDAPLSTVTPPSVSQVSVSSPDAPLSTVTPPSFDIQALTPDNVGALQTGGYQPPMRVDVSGTPNFADSPGSYSDTPIPEGTQLATMDQSDDPNSGARYDPASNSWIIDAPPPEGEVTTNEDANPNLSGNDTSISNTDTTNDENTNNAKIYASLTPEQQVNVQSLVDIGTPVSTAINQVFTLTPIDTTSPTDTFSDTTQLPPLFTVNPPTDTSSDTFSDTTQLDPVTIIGTQSPLDTISTDQTNLTSTSPLGTTLNPVTIIGNKLPPDEDQNSSTTYDSGTQLDPVTIVGKQIDDTSNTDQNPIQLDPVTIIGKQLPPDLPPITPVETDPINPKIPPLSTPTPKVAQKTPTKTTKPTTSSGLSNTQSSSSPLSSKPSFLAGAPVYKSSPSHEEQLKQIYSSLTPELQNVFQQQGIVTNQPVTNQTSDDEQFDPSLNTKFVASGGSIDDEINFKPVFNSPRMLQAAPTSQDLEALMGKANSRYSPLKQLYSTIGARPSVPFSQPMAKGGLPSKYEEAKPDDHHPEFITGLTGYYAQGGGTGQSDDIPAMLHDGDYVMDADTVASFGDGSSKAGAELLDNFRKQVPHHSGQHGQPVPAQIADGEYVFPASFVASLGGGDNKRGAKLLDKIRQELREHKRSAPINKIPPKAKTPLSYLKGAKG
jgi:hypothetical protein